MMFSNLSGFGPKDSHDSFQNAQPRRHFGDQRLHQHRERGSSRNRALPDQAENLAR